MLQPKSFRLTCVALQLLVYLGAAVAQETASEQELPAPATLQKPKSENPAGRLTVEQLRQLLGDQLAGHKSDGSIASRLASLELTERLTEPTLQQMVAAMKPGPKAALALDMLADLSALLDAPANELPARDAPDFTTQHSMIEGAVSFAEVALGRLPNFMATRTTRSFDDAPVMAPQRGAFLEPGELHQVVAFSESLAYRDGREVSITPDKKQSREAARKPTSSQGDFGQTLVTILADCAKGKLYWSHWEQISGGLAAVFHYEVPAEASHYVVAFGVATDGAGNIVQVKHPDSHSYLGTPGYHGSLYVDPSRGAVLRYTLESELKPTDPISRSAIWVQYGKVDIGSRDYLCPVQSGVIGVVSVHAYHFVNELKVLRISERSFTDYHRYGSTRRILADAPFEEVVH